MIDLLKNRAVLQLVMLALSSCNPKSEGTKNKMVTVDKKRISTDSVTSGGLNDTKKPSVSFTADGIWKVDCEKGLGSISIEGKNADMVVLFNQVYIDLVELKRDDAEKSIAYKLKEIPGDVGTIGIKLNWKEYVNDQPLANI